MRGINEKFVKDLLNGELAFFLQKVKENNDLTFEIRNQYVNIYYRGGSLLKIKQKKESYYFKFDYKYSQNKKNINIENYETIKSMDKNSPTDYEKNFQILIDEMDSWFEDHPKCEREYQHNLTIHNPSVMDIEYQINKTRLDMIMIQNGRLVIVENKYRLKSISGKAGLSKHYKDICTVIKNRDLRNELAESMLNISRNKYELGLIDADFLIEDIERAEADILFLLVDFNPRSETLNNEIALMDKSIPAHLLYMVEDDEYIIDYAKAMDLFS